MVSTSAVERLYRAAILALLAGTPACSPDSNGKSSSGAKDSGTADSASRDGAAASGVTPAPDKKPWATLAEWHLFKDPVKQEPQDRVVPYDVIAPLFTDYAYKRRFIYVPEGQHITYQAKGHWDFPVGSILVKTFSYLADARDPSKGERLLETRLLIHETEGWTPHTYIWNTEQTAANLQRAGEVLATEFIDPSGASRKNAYVVPSESDCRQCHGKLGETNTIGGKTLQLDRDHDYGKGPENQIDHLAGLGYFDGTPPPASERQHLVDPFDTSLPLDERVRSYFDGNCSHCHRPVGAPGSLSGLWLDYDSTAPGQPPLHFGLCKRPASAGHGTCGRDLDVIPGQPEASILTCRVESTLPDTQMPPLGRRLVHTEGAALIREWVAALPGSCDAPSGRDAGPAGDGGEAGTEAGSAEAGSDAAPDATGMDSGPG